MDYCVIFQVYWCENTRRGVMRFWVLRNLAEVFCTLPY